MFPVRKSCSRRISRHRINLCRTVPVAAMVCVLWFPVLLRAQTEVTGEQQTIPVAATVTWDDIMALDAGLAGEKSSESRVIPYLTRFPDQQKPPGGLSDPTPQDGFRFDRVPSMSADALTAPIGINNFEALPTNNTTIPPDTHGGVGPNHVMTMLNSQVRIQDRAGGILSTVGLQAFWLPAGANTYYDPKVLYDADAGRWIATCDANPFSPGTSLAGFAISATDNPMGTWTFYVFAPPPGGVWFDYPSLGHNRTWYAIINNMFTTTPAYQGSSMWVIDKATALAGGAVTATLFPTGFDVVSGFGGFTLKACVTYGSEPTLYIVDNDTPTNNLRLSQITGTGPAPVWSLAPGGSPTGQFPVNNGWQGQINAAQSGTAVRISTNDPRMLNAVYRNGRVWCTHSGGLPAAGAVNRTGVFWYEIDPAAMPNPIVQDGVLDGGAGIHYYFPSIAVNRTNDVLLGFTHSDAGTFAEAVWTGRNAFDPPGTMDAPQVLKVGEDTYTETYGGTAVRWGDYSSSVVDPVDDWTFWTIQEYANDHAACGDPDGCWGTWWGEFEPGPPTLPVTVNTVDVVFLIDITGSVGPYIRQWQDLIDIIMNRWRAWYPTVPGNPQRVRFALCTHRDFPFSSYGGGGDYAYRVHSRLPDSDQDLVTQLNLLTAGGGLDSPESQYEALWQVLASDLSGTPWQVGPAGRDLDDPLYTGTGPWWTTSGEYPPIPIGQTSPMCLYHFTFPDNFHDPNLEAAYPVPRPAGIAPFPTPDVNWVGSEATVGQAIQAQRNAFTYFGLTQASPKRGVADSQDGQDDPVQPVAQNMAASASGNLQRLADATDGHVFYLRKDSLEFGQDLLLDIDSSIQMWSEGQQAQALLPLGICIDKVHALNGGIVDVAVSKVDPWVEMGGFDFLIWYDPSALTFLKATRGALLDSLEWEYFTYRTGAGGNCPGGCPDGLIRLVAIADLDNGASLHPINSTDWGTLANLQFQISSDRNLINQCIPVKFYWADCGDNTVSSVSGDTTYIDVRIVDPLGDLLWDEDDDDLFPDGARPGGLGAPDACLEGGGPGKPLPIRRIEFCNGWICIDEPPDDRGDINLNGIANEVADAVLFSNYFIYGEAVWDATYQETQILATDINDDGVVLTIADLVYLIRIITGDEQPFPPGEHPKRSPHASAASVDWRIENDELVVDWRSTADAGAVLLTFDHQGGEFGAPMLGENAAGMVLLSHNDGIQLRVLIEGMESGARIAAGHGTILRVPIVTADPDLVLSRIEAADYWGNTITTSIVGPASVPRSFALLQNVPNPFNASTGIDFSLPEAGDVTLIVYDVLGRKVATLVDKRLEPGAHHIEWQARDDSGRPLASGVYFYRITTTSSQASRKMVLLK